MNRSHFPIAVCRSFCCDKFRNWKSKRLLPLTNSRDVIAITTIINVLQMSVPPFNVQLKAFFIPKIVHKLFFFFFLKNIFINRKTKSNTWENFSFYQMILWEWFTCLVWCLSCWLKKSARHWHLDLLLHDDQVELQQINCLTIEIKRYRYVWRSTEQLNRIFGRTIAGKTQNFIKKNVCGLRNLQMFVIHVSLLPTIAIVVWRRKQTLEWTEVVAVLVHLFLKKSCVNLQWSLVFVLHCVTFQFPIFVCILLKSFTN